jgi:hypothetical protein
VTLVACTSAEQDAAIATATAIAQTGNPSVPVVVTINETFGVGDTPAPVGPAGVVTNESFTVADDPYVLGPLVFTVNESFSLGDALVPLGPLVLQINESFSLSDSPFFTPPEESTHSDAVSIVDSVDITVVSGSPPTFNVPDVDEGMDVKAGVKFEVIVSFSDKDSEDTHEATIDWGDGKIEPAKLEQTQHFVGGGHTYESAGTYKVTIVLTDSSGLSVTGSFEVRAHAVASKDKDEGSEPPPPDDGGGKGK